MILIVLCAFAASKHVEKKQERRELFVVTLTVACAAAVVGAVASAVTTNALNNQGQTVAPVQQPVQVHVHLYRNENGEWVQGPPPNGGPNGGADMSTARRLLAASADSGGTQNAQACPANTLKLPVGQYENGGYRILDKYAKISETECAWWDSKEAMKMDQKYGIKALMPPGCMPFTAKATSKSGTAAKQAIQAKGIKTAGVRSEVSVATPVSKWQPMVVVAFGLALVMVACFAACRKNANQGVAYVHLADDVDEL